MTLKKARAPVFVLAALLAPAAAPATGHGPVYGLATPTLGRNAWSLDVGVMGRSLRGVGVVSAMARPLASYGITEDFQASLSLPIPLYTREGAMPVRMMAMMPANPDAEVLLGWRFHRQATDIGARFESTAYLGLDYPTDSLRAGVETSPGISAAAVTGYASRSIYAWAGGLYRRYMSPRGPASDHPGDLAMVSLVVGYRPALFRKELPHADWRVFLEAVAERLARDEAAGRKHPNSGGDRVFAGPTALGLYGSWGLSGGPLFPVYQKLNGSQRKDRVRYVVNFTYWF